MSYYVSYVHGWESHRRFRGPYRSIKSALEWAMQKSKDTFLCTQVQNKVGDKVFATVGVTGKATRYRGGFCPDKELVWAVVDPERPEGD